MPSAFFRFRFVDGADYEDMTEEQRYGLEENCYGFHQISLKIIPFFEPS
jgi:hypothetical protein